MGYKCLYIKIYTKKDSGIMASVTVPHTFTNGYAADANEVNANFAALKAFVDASLVQIDGSAVNAATSITKAMLVAAVQESIAPAGSILLYGGSSAPTGWLICNGATLSTTTYGTLFAVVGYTYGGSGGNFLLPSMTNKFAFGGTPGVGGGSATILEANLPVHYHSITGPTGGMSANSTLSHSITDPNHHHTETSSVTGSVTTAYASGANAFLNTGSVTVDTTSAATGISIASHTVSHDHTLPSFTGNTGSGTAYYQPHVVFNYIIKS